VLYKRHQPDVLAYFLRRLNRDDAVEATADVFLTAWRRVEELPPDPEIRPWLFGVAHNVLSNRNRSARRRRRLVARLVRRSDAVTPLAPEMVVVRQAEDEAVVAAMARLPARDREVLALRLWEETSYDEIAAIVGCSRHAAEQRYAKALRRFRRVWGEAGHVSMSGTIRSHRGQERIHEA
jgi:RNA polymerase sigma-70 factor (ECF subfamily)